MTKTFSQVMPNRFANPDLLVMMSLDLTAGRSYVWNFEFVSLEFV